MVALLVALSGGLFVPSTTDEASTTYEEAPTPPAVEIPETPPPDSPDYPTPVELVQIVKDVAVIDKIVVAAEEAGIDPLVAVRIAECESTLNPRARNPGSSAKGLYQFTDTTWEYIGAKGHQFDVDENIRQFMKWYPTHPGWWVCK